MCKTSQDLRGFLFFLLRRKQHLDKRKKKNTIVISPVLKILEQSNSGRIMDKHDCLHGLIFSSGH